MPLACASRSGGSDSAASAARTPSLRVDRGGLSGAEPHKSIRGIPRRSRAATISCMWRPRPPTPGGGPHETITLPSGRTLSCALAVPAHQAGPSGHSPRPLGAGSVKLLIAPQRDEVAPQILAQRHDLGLEEPAQLLHELLVWGRRLAVDELAEGR